MKNKMKNTWENNHALKFLGKILTIRHILIIYMLVLFTFIFSFLFYWNSFYKSNNNKNNNLNLFAKQAIISNVFAYFLAPLVSFK
ncbi:putative prtein, predicted transmembrane protein [Metamycoplasma alkalescens 14918]|uniref:Putative prtein, predicted transmembrane protein n=1 Tax=Metamycoplasma alkalescens 14918 TaxID=1188234 RepID=N9UAL6_9BACT|nr:putative prtein, predicted transmembrane protein [Metamycoplasma alkalescens 14918]